MVEQGWPFSNSMRRDEIRAIMQPAETSAPRNPSVKQVIRLRLCLKKNNVEYRQALAETAASKLYDLSASHGGSKVPRTSVGVTLSVSDFSAFQN